MKTLDKFVGLVVAFSIVAMLALVFLSIGIDPLIPFSTARRLVDVCIIVLAIAAFYGFARSILYEYARNGK